MKFLGLTVSDRYPKKFKAVFRLDSGRTKTIHFGDRRYGDYTQHHSKVRRDLYLQRHVSREDWTKPDTAGTLSAFILWGESTDILKNLLSYLKHFRL
jgi:hypothetical protein